MRFNKGAFDANIEKQLEEMMLKIAISRGWVYEVKSGKKQMELRWKSNPIFSHLVDRVDRLVPCLRNRIASIDYKVKPANIYLTLNSKKHKHSVCKICLSVTPVRNGSRSIIVLRDIDKLRSIGSQSIVFDSVDDAWQELLSICAEYAVLRPE